MAGPTLCPSTLRSSTRWRLLPTAGGPFLCFTCLVRGSSRLTYAIQRLRHNTATLHGAAHAAAGAQRVYARYGYGG